ncbi:MAG: M56 family metallopeptidase [Pirellulaceae bacterium]|jgi:beta-lactamase regulating signal transducer with metallopeptidase domain
MWDFILWNTLIASLFAILLKGFSHSQFLRRRPALVSLAWLLVLVKLCIPACLAIPLWSTLTSQNYFRNVDTIALESREAQATSLERVASMMDEFPRTRWDTEFKVDEFARGEPVHATSVIPIRSPQNVTGNYRQWLAGTWPRILDTLPDYRAVLLAVWMLVTFAIVVRVGRQHRRLHHIMAQARHNQELSAVARRLAQRLGCRAAPEVRTIQANVSPALVGWVRPAILIPNWAVGSLTADELNAVLTHELSHFRRRDHWQAAVATLLSSLWWWNPVAWLAVRELRHWQELSCDALALASQVVSPKDYARTLWRIVLQLQESPQVMRPALAIAGDRDRCRLFQRRLKLLLEGRRAGRLSKLSTVALTALAVASICYPTARAAPRPPHAFSYVVTDELNPHEVEAVGAWPTLSQAAATIDPQLMATVVARGHFWFGTGDRPVLMALVTRAGDKRLELLVDGDRNELLEQIDLAQSTGESTWRADVRDAPTAAGPTSLDQAPRDDTSNQSLSIRWTGQYLRIANLGHLEGKILSQQQPDISFATRIEDRNCNGLWTDKEDRLHLDWNRDGQYSPLREQYSCQGSPSHGGQRYSLAFADDVLSLKPLIGSGTIVPRIALADSSAAIVSCRAVLASSDGVHVTLSNLDAPLSVPVGDYSVKQLRIELKDERHWFASFEQKSGERTTVRVAKESQVELELLGELKLSAEINGRASADVQAGLVVVHPMLTSQSGLYLSRSAVGKLSAQNDNPLTASLIEFGTTKLKPKPKAIAMESTGFGCGAFCPISFSGDELIAGRTMVHLRFDSGPLAGLLTKTISTK